MVTGCEEQLISIKENIGKMLLTTFASQMRKMITKDGKTNE